MLSWDELAEGIQRAPRPADPPRGQAGRRDVHGHRRAQRGQGARSRRQGDRGRAHRDQPGCGLQLRPLEPASGVPRGARSHGRGDGPHGRRTLQDRGRPARQEEHRRPDPDRRHGGRAGASGHREPGILHGGDQRQPLPPQSPAGPHAGRWASALLRLRSRPGSAALIAKARGRPAGGLWPLDAPDGVRGVQRPGSHRALQLLP